MHSLELSTESIKALHKFLGAQGLSSLEAAGLGENEKEAVLDAYGTFRGEVEEIQLDEFYDKKQEQADA